MARCLSPCRHLASASSKGGQWLSGSPAPLSHCRGHGRCSGLPVCLPPGWKLRLHPQLGSRAFGGRLKGGPGRRGRGKSTLPVGKQPLPLQPLTGARPRQRRPHLERTPRSAPRSGTHCCGTGSARPELGWTPRWVARSSRCLGYGRNAPVSCVRLGVLGDPPNVSRGSTLGLYDIAKLKTNSTLFSPR